MAKIVIVLVLFFKSFSQDKRKLFHSPSFLVLFFFTILSCSLTFAIASTPWGKGRFQQTALVTTTNTHEYTQFIDDGTHISFERFFHNKFQFFTHEFLIQYFSYFNPNFLFTQGGLPQWFSTPTSGLFHLSFLCSVFLFFYPLARKQTCQKQINDSFCFC